LDAASRKAGTPSFWVVLAVAVLVLIAVVVPAAIRKRRSRELQQRSSAETIGPLQRTGDRQRADSALKKRSQRREAREVRPPGR
jgi:flagellar biosynthesis/type III secretory pathway M-ring protein FliF/YscJ